MPKCPEENIYKSVLKFVNKAITLKDSMTEEQAMYRPYWVQSGERFDSGVAEVTEGQNGTVYFCLFPGLARLVPTAQGVKSTAYALKAAVILSNAF